MDKSNIVHVISGRRIDPNSFKTLLKEAISIVDESQDVLLIGNSFRDFFTPLDEYIKAILLKGVKIKVLLLDPTSLAAYNRALVEEREKIDPKSIKGFQELTTAKQQELLSKKREYIDTALFKGIKAVAEFLDDPGEFQRDLKERIINQIEVRFNPYDPTTHMLIFDKYILIEQYHRGGDEEIRNTIYKQYGQKITSVDCFGGFIPLLMIRNHSDNLNSKLMKRLKDLLDLPGISLILNWRMIMKQLKKVLKLSRNGLRK